MLNRRHNNNMRRTKNWTKNQYNQKSLLKSRRNKKRQHQHGQKLKDNKKKRKKKKQTNYQNLPMTQTTISTWKTLKFVMLSRLSRKGFKILSRMSIGNKIWLINGIKLLKMTSIRIQAVFILISHLRAINLRFLLIL